MSLWPLQNSSYSGISLSYCVNVTVSGPANFTYIQDQLPHMESKILAIDDSKPQVSYRVQASASRPFRTVQGVVFTQGQHVICLQVSLQGSRAKGCSVSLAGLCSVCAGLGAHAGAVPHGLPPESDVQWV